MPPDRAQHGQAAHRLGLDAEAVAEATLLREGWAVLARCVRTPAGELDLVAERDRLLALIEVKARPSWREAAFALTARQQSRLLAAAEAWMAHHPGHGVGACAST